MIGAHGWLENSEEGLASLLGLGRDCIVEHDLAMRLALEWHGTFCPNLIEWAKQKPKRGYRWESVIFVESAGDNALKEYSLQHARTYFIMPEMFGYKEHVMYQTDEKPEFHGLMDFYVFPKNMAWSMAFTHESGWLGPYFLKHKDYGRLQKKNIEALNARRT